MHEVECLIALLRAIKYLSGRAKLISQNETNGVNIKSDFTFSQKTL